MTSDKQLVRERFEANFKKYDRLAVVQQRICAELTSLAGRYCRLPVSNILEIGIGTGFFTSRLAMLWPDAFLYLNDLVPAAEAFVAKYVAGGQHEYLWGDAEDIAFPPGLDMVASASTVQWFDDLPGFIAKASASTKTGGHLLLSTFGQRNFHEIRATTGEGLEYYSLEDLSEIVKGEGYEILDFDQYAETLTFDSPVSVLKHIKATGVNSLHKSRWTKGRLAEFEKQYREKFSNEGGVTLTYHPILIVAVKR